MRKMKRMAGAVLRVIGVGVLCVGCALLPRQKSKQTEAMLSAAGFTIKAADTPEKRAALAAKPQRKIKFLRRHGKTYFAYVDADGCGCAYLGDQVAYQKYLGMLDQQRTAGEDSDAPEVDEDAAIVEDDGIWESWGGDPWGGGSF
jgi:hypothetical protein